MAEAAGVSRSLVHAYLGDRRGLLDAVQVRIVSRLDTAASPGLGGDGAPADHLRALVGRVFAFVAAEQDAWGVLVVSGGLDHPALHGIRSRWAAALAAAGPDQPPAERLAPRDPDDRPDDQPDDEADDDADDPADRVVAAQAVVAALLFGVGGWVHRGVDPARVTAPLLRALRARG